MTSSEIDQLRLKLLEAPDSSNWTQSDIRLIKESDFTLDILLSTNKNINGALKSAKKLLNWRKENNVDALKATSFAKEIHQTGYIFVIPSDRNQRPVLLLRMCIPSPPRYSYSLATQYFIYNFEKFFQTILSTGRKPAVVLDFDDARLDLLQIKEVLYIIAYIYPPYVESITFCNLSWSYNAIFQFIKRFLPSSMSDMIIHGDQEFLENLTEKKEDLPHYLGGNLWNVTYEEWLASPNFEESDAAKVFNRKQLDELSKYFKNVSAQLGNGWTLESSAMKPIKTNNNNTLPSNTKAN